MNTHALYSSLGLAWQLLRRDLHERHAGMLLGTWWWLVQPLILLGLYTWVFGAVLQLRFAPHDVSNNFSYAHYLFAGLVVFNAFSEVLTRAPTCISDRRDLLLNTPLPLWILPLLPVASSIVLEWLGLAVLVGVLLISGHASWSLIWLYWPLLLVRLVLSLAASYSLACLGVFLRDLRQIMPAFLTVLLFITPILYPLHSVPADYRAWYDWNALGHLVQAYRSMLFEANLKAALLMSLLFLASVLLGFAALLFQILAPRVRFAL
ncbi:ABC transporter permease [Thiolinea disciformis]|uniref:ABC transporter permease n=1 Tax=Thiolinea disciformis TaxID=125614 RepID=UPI00036D5C9F|nr:ABC transporter permease [Thiolinea disciformis]